MKKKKIYLIITLSIIGLAIIIFLLMGFLRKGNGPMIPPVKINYPKLDKNTLYTERIFDTSYIHEINIKISNKDWEDLRTNPMAKKKYKVDVIIDGEKTKDVAIRTKGNSSLKNIAEGPGGGPASDRYSFKLIFGAYKKNQTYFNLDTLNLNNLYGDTSYINDHIAYELFKQMEVPAPLSSFAYIKVNGKNFGLYSIIEEIGNSFMKRNNLEGNLYKPEQLRGKDYGSSLTYTDNNYDNYRDIFNNSQSIINNADKDRLIIALKNLNNNTDLEQYLDTEEIIKYFAVHNFLLSYDSYTGKSIHNYYLLENNGKISIIPWDYNLSFGRYNMLEDINTIVNYGIDSPLSRASSQNRPLWRFIEKNDLYLSKYHNEINLLINNYFETKKYNEFIDTSYKVIEPYVPLDISAFYSKEQVDNAINTLKDFCKYRSESIRLQLNGELSTITSNQVKEKQIDASSIDLNNLGLIADDRLKQNNNNKNNNESSKNNESHSEDEKHHSTSEQENNTAN